MAQTATVSRDIDRPVDQTATLVTDMSRLMDAISTFSRCRFIEDADDGQVWELYLDSATIYLGGRVLVTSPEPDRLQWRSLSGTRHTFDARVEPTAEGSRITLSLSFALSGYGIAKISELVGRGMVTRHLHAAAEEIRHHVEFGN